jgi:hypothetical protein
MDITSIFPPSWEAVMLTFTTDEAMVFGCGTIIVSARAPFLSKIWSSYASDSLGFYHPTMIFSLKLSLLRNLPQKIDSARLIFFFRRDHPPQHTLHYTSSTPRAERPPLDHRQRTRLRAPPSTPM